MQPPALLLAITLAQGCVHPAFVGSDTTDTLASCRAHDSCGSGDKDSKVIVGIVLGAAVVAITLAMHRYVLSSG